MMNNYNNFEIEKFFQIKKMNKQEILDYKYKLLQQF